MIDLLHAIALLLTEGDYTAPLNLLGMAEDSPVIDLILTALGY